jgi:hypothetical protein
MADTVTTIRPNGDEGTGAFTPTGAGTCWQALSDNSDSSYVTASVAGFGGFDLSTFSVPDLAVIHSVTIRARLSAVGLAGERVGVRLWSGAIGGSSSTAFVYSPTPSGTITTYTLGSFTITPGGTTWTQGAIDALEAELQLATKIHELYLDVAYNQAPTATVTAPTGTSSTNSRPPVQWTYADPEGDTQERFQVRIFSAAQYGAGGFDPDVSTATWDSGERISGAVTVTPASLPDGTYRAYVQVADVGSGGRYGPWDYIGFTVAVADPPTAPDISAAADLPNGRIIIDLTDTNPSLDPALTYSATIDRSINAGASWTPVRVAIGSAAPTFNPIPIPTAGIDYPNLYDYESPYDGGVTYRAIETADDGAGGELLGSYGTSSSISFLSDDTWLKDPLSPVRNMVIDLQLPFESRRRMRSTATDTLGSKFPIGRSDGVKGTAGKAVIDTIGSSIQAKLDTLLQSGHTLFLQIPDIAARYLIVVSDIDIIEVDDANIFCVWSFDWVEVAAP